MGRDDLIDDPRYSTNEARIKHKKEVTGFIEEWTMQHTKHQVMKLLADAGITAGACLNAEDLHSDPHLLEREMIVTVDHPQRGPFTFPGSPIKLSDSALTITPSPLLCQHTEEVLEEVLGYDRERVGRLRDAGVV